MTTYKSTMQENGQIALPPEWLEKHGVCTGDEIEMVANDDGSLTLLSNDVIAMKLVDEIGEALRATGISLEDFLEEGDKIRQEIYEEKYAHKVGEDA